METKKMGQVFTPKYIVQNILDKLQFFDENLIAQTIMEPSFGDGAFLIEIVERILHYCLDNKLSKEFALNIVINNVYGIEKDRNLYKTAINNIKNVFSKYKINYNGTFPNLICDDAFTIYEQFNNKFDIVCGNPPYVNIHSIEDKDKIREFRYSTNGMTDLYIAFFEMGIDMLNQNGKLGYITPNSYFTSIAGKNMRKEFIEKNLLYQIIDFGHEQIFENVLTYTCITILDKQHKKKKVKFSQNKQNCNILFYPDFYLNQNFYFTVTSTLKNIITYNNTKFCLVKNGCATLKDNFFINSEIAQKSKFSIPIVKSSTGKRYKCFYPYDENGNVISYSELSKDEITIKILLENKETLLNRNLHNTSLWYAFGRTQAISDTYKNKYGINAIFKTQNDIHITKCEKGCAVYGGMYILSDLNYTVIKEILFTEDFIEYVSVVGKYKNGGYYAVSTKDIEKYLNYNLSILFSSKTISI